MTQRDCFIPGDLRDRMKAITDAGRKKGYEYGEGAGFTYALFKASSHLAKAGKSYFEDKTENWKWVEHHLFKVIWWCLRQIYIIRTDTSYGQKIYKEDKDVK